ncbi:MAG: sugar-transfer associated ATP-grasp domain-containing protein [Burkholderiaceae bacterium]|jgi:hypothetical protein|nr:sugar-transfer associated ATP-grasp domain-containing protein [Burkholderiaceae bacterium]
MRRIKPALREVRRLARQYSLGISQEAKETGSLIGGAYRIARARLGYGVGPLYYSLYRFSTVPQSEWGNYVTDDPAFKERLRGMSRPAMHRIAQNKALMYQHCVRHGVPTIPVFCLIGDSPDPLGPEVRSGNDLAEWRAVMQSSPGDLFVKSVDGTYGEGSFAVSHVRENLYRYEGVEGTIDDLHRHIQAKLSQEKGWIVQPRIRSHPGLGGVVSSHGLATARVVTAMQEGAARAVVAGFKVTVGTNATDNFSKGASGNLLAGIDLATGTLSRAWGSRRKDWPEITDFEIHPETGKKIAGFTLPLWNDLVQCALRAQESLPELRSAGWDIAISERGVLVVEANLTYDLSILQIAHQRGLKREISSVLESAQR